MKIEILIYGYLAVCASMIVFNIVCIFAFRHRDKKLSKSSMDFRDLIRQQMTQETVSEDHKKFLRKKLRRVSNLMAFDESLEVVYREDPEAVVSYLQKLHSVFIYLTMEYQRKGEVQAAYFPYIIKKYHILYDTSVSLVTDILLNMVSSSNLYCRENALEAIYSIGDANIVVEALKILDQTATYHHGKLITDGLLTFTGDHNLLARKLWDQYPKFSTRIRLTILDYLRFSNGNYGEQLLRILKDPKEDHEIRYSCMRYYGKYHYLPALPVLSELATGPVERWEYRAIAAKAMGNYPSKKVEVILKELLSSSNWYVRYNAAESLEKLGVSYYDLIDVLEGPDRYASEILRYRFDRKRLNQTEEAVSQ